MTYCSKALINRISLMIGNEQVKSQNASTALTVPPFEFTSWWSCNIYRPYRSIASCNTILEQKKVKMRKKRLGNDGE